MEITETLNENLRREFRIVVGAKDLDEKLTGKITELQPRVHLKGFRPGKAPVSFLKKTYGKSLMGEIVNDVVNQSSAETLEKHALKPASTPQTDFVSALDSVVEGKADLEFTMKVDLMPEFEIANLADLSAERLVADVTDEEVEESLARLADAQRTYADKGEGAVAENGDAVTIDFEGSIDGEPFEGGKAEDYELMLGSGAFVPGFEEQLVGAKAGERKTVTVRFPDDYGAEHLAGREARFDVAVKAVKAAQPVAVDDELAKRLGVDSLAALKDLIRNQLKTEHARASRTHLKRRILDALDAAYDFPLPPGMVEAEFNTIWRQVEEEIAREGKSPDEEEKSEDELKAEYRAIAERRVRLGLLLARIGEQNGLAVTQEEINRAIAARARQFPGQEQQVVQFYANNPQAQAEIRVPIFEDKVVDFIAELIQVKDRAVPRDILFLDPDSAAERLEAESGKAAAGGTGTKKRSKSEGGKGKAAPKAKKATKKKED